METADLVHWPRRRPGGISGEHKRKGAKTEALLRFSTVTGERGAADAERDVRGFAFEVLHQRGQLGSVGNNTPVFFVRDPYKFPDFIHTQKRDPRTNMRDIAAMRDFWSLSPESLHQVTILMSDRGVPRSLREENGCGSHTNAFINAAGERHRVKFHFKTMQGIHFLHDDDAGKLIGEDRESHQRDLFSAIERGDVPKWKMQAQIMPEADADKAPYNPFDLTKVWPHKDYPPIDIGILELNRNPDFSPANVVPGISHSPDKMLQFRIVSYADAHRDRLGINYEELPVNKPKVEGRTYYRDGSMRYGEPNSRGGPVEDPRFEEPPLKVSGDADRYDHRDGNDDYSQVGALFRLMGRDGQARLMGQHRAPHGRPCAGGDHAPADRPFRQDRPGLWRRCRRASRPRRAEEGGGRGVRDRPTRPDAAAALTPPPRPGMARA